MSRRTRESVPIQRGEGPSDKEQSAYDKAIASAKAKGGRRVKPDDMEGVPRFDEVAAAPKMRGVPTGGPGGPGEAPEELSGDTAKGLAALAQGAAQRQQADTAPPVQDEEKEFSLDDIQEMFDLTRADAAQVEGILYPERRQTEADRMRRAIESRCGDMDIGQYLMNGYLTQQVPVIEPGESHKGLEVVYRTIPGSLEVYVDRVLSEEASAVRTLRKESKSVDVEMSTREYQRRSSEWALAAYIQSYQGKQWPQHLNRDGAVDEDAMQQRLALVRQIPSHLFNLLSTNLGWFIERSIKVLNVAIMGNG